MKNCFVEKSKLQNRYHVSAAEIDEQDTHKV